MRGCAIVCAIVVVTLSSGCHVPDIVGTIECTSNADCAPPTTICGVDTRCVAGCPEAACVAGATCTPATGECAGGIIGTACTTDTDCDPPEVVCRAATHTCAAGCILTGTCPTGLACNRSSGRCCDADDDPSCQANVAQPTGCGDDSDCAPPKTICSQSACVAGCTNTSCTAPQTCDTRSGHCATPHCGTDADCDDTSSCTQASTCTPLTEPSHGKCAGGTNVSYDCAQSKSASSFSMCVGKPGATSCPYCIEQSCFAPGLCSTDADCDGGMACMSGLCFATSPQCATVVQLEDVVNGVYGAGKEVCVRAQVTSVGSGYDGPIEVRLGMSPYLYVDVLQMYEGAGVKLPTVGDTVTVHGRVRWDDAHGDRELLPVDWIDAAN